MTDSEFIREIKKKGIVFFIKEKRIRAFPGEEIADLKDEIEKRPEIIKALALKKKKNSLGEVVEVRMMCDSPTGCWKCEKWAPEFCDGERTGLCVARGRGVKTNDLRLCQSQFY